MPEDNFTFVRLLHRGHKEGYTDFPRAEENFTKRLQELTSLQVNPEFKQLEMDDPELFNYPFAFMSNVDRINEFLFMKRMPKRCESTSPMAASS